MESNTESLPIKYILLFFAILFLLTGSLKITINSRSVKFNGLVWVALDRYTIYKYDSKDTPMNIIEL